MTDTTDYYALLSPADLKTPVGVFRVRRSDGGLFLESWTGGTWIDGPYSLGRYVYDGEPGAEAIAAAEADRITNLPPGESQLSPA